MIESAWSIPDNKFTQKELVKELNILIRSGMMDTFLNEDGEWVYKLTKMESAELGDAAFFLDELDGNDYDNDDGWEPSSWGVDIKEVSETNAWYLSCPPHNWEEINPNNWGQIAWVKMALKEWGYLPVEFQSYISDAEIEHIKQKRENK
jgi:hypothetical protein